jgi:hypothetical protein
MGESFDHCPPGRIRQSGERCTQFIHNHMVVDYLSMSSVNLAKINPGQTGAFPILIDPLPGTPS